MRKTRLRSREIVTLLALVLAGCGGAPTPAAQVARRPAGSQAAPSANHGTDPIVARYHETADPPPLLLVTYQDDLQSAIVEVVAPDDDLIAVVDWDHAGTAILRYRTDVVHCAYEGCSTLLSLARGASLYGIRRSPSGTHVFIVSGTEGQGVVDIYDLDSRERTAHFVADGWLARGGMPLGWVNDERLAVTWSAGTSVALAMLFDTAGTCLLDVYCDSMTENGPFLACWSPPSAPLGGAQSGLVIYDLAAPPGAFEMEVPPDLRDPSADIRSVAFVRDGAWVLIGDELRVRYVDVWGP